MQHKKELGNLYVFAVTIFHCSRPDKAACLLFEIGSAPEQKKDGAALVGLVSRRRDSLLDLSE
jgi:hypothetical protein